jgi:hypothetical protein
MTGINTGLPDELLAMRRRDLEVRERLVRERRLHDDYAGDMRNVHQENARKLDDLVTRQPHQRHALSRFDNCRYNHPA